MTQDVPVRCSCGTVQGVIRGLSPASSNHVLCPCNGCQAYAHFLGRADDMLDAKGYSNIFQMNPADFDITDGLDHVACMRVTPDGPLRWYTSCCKTPLGNTAPRGGVPFLGVLPICTGHKGTSDKVVAMVGPVRAKVNDKARSTTGDKARSFFMIVRLFAKLLGWRVRGGPSWKPFFDKDTMKPIRDPLVLTDDERETLYRKVV